MLTKLNQYFESLFEQESTQSNHQNTIELASAVLMIEIALADGHFDSDEKSTIKSLIQTEFEMDEAQLDALIELAEAEVDQSVSLQSFTRLLTDQLEMEQRIKVIRDLWRIAFADAVIDKYEEYHIRKIADLLYISHADYIKAKHDADKNN
ncbi:MAG: TerB family tellurite resistance protein [Pseudomonadota bacterium]